MKYGHYQDHNKYPNECPGCAFEAGQKASAQDRAEKMATFFLAAILSNADPEFRAGAGTIHGAAVYHARELIKELNKEIK